MNCADSKPLTETETLAVLELLQNPRLRIQVTSVPGERTLWVKQVEQLSFLKRLQKGDPQKALRAEAQSLRALHKIGQPVPELLQEGQNHIVLSDVGTNIELLMVSDKLPESDASRVFAGVGRVLAGLHKSGYAHGRPVLRDFCWDGSKVTMIDLERFEFRERRHRTLALDLVIFTQGWFARTGVEDNQAELLDVTFAAYRDEAPSGPWQAISKWLKMLGPLRPILALMLWLRPGWREVRGALWTMEYLALQLSTLEKAKAHT